MFSMGEFKSLLVLAKVGMKLGLNFLVFMCTHVCVFLLLFEPVTREGCFAVFLAKDSDNLTGLTSSLSRSTVTRAFS